MGQAMCAFRVSMCIIIISLSIAISDSPGHWLSV